MVINVLLVVLATATLIIGGSYRLSEKNTTNFTVRIMTVNMFTIWAWLMGYAMLGFNTNEQACTIWRAVGLVGIVSTILFEFLFVRTVANMSRKYDEYLYIALIGYSLVTLHYLSLPANVEFVRIGNRTAYYIQKSVGRTMEGILIGFLFVTMFGMAIKWYRTVKRKREKQVVFIMIVAHFILIFSCIPDTLLPILGKPSFPSSGIGAFICYLFNLYVAQRLNAFNISEHNMHQYIFNKVNTGVLLFDADYKLAAANQYAHDFFGITDIKTTKISDLFQISEEDAVALFKKLSGRLDNSEVNLTSQKKSVACSLILNTVYDDFGEAMCYVCFVYDRTRDMALYEEVNKMKQSLQRELMEKTYEMEKFTLQSITTIANTIDAKDLYTKGHSVRVAEYSALIAKAIGFSEDQIQRVKYCALLHDIGKIGVSETVLNKPGKLTDEEYEHLKTHTTIGAQILKDIKAIPDLDIGAKYHHERYDGKGYPQGIAGEEIPLMARIIGIADAYDAMNSRRVYRDMLTKEKIESELLNGRGTQFDPYLLDQFMEMYRQGRIRSEYDETHSLEGLMAESNKMLEDIQDDIRKESEKSMEYDALTGLMNKTSAVTAINAALENEQGAFVYLDLDNMDENNRTFGEKSGDDILKMVAEILKNQPRKTIAARVGGDEFVYYIAGVNEAQTSSILDGILYTFRIKKIEAKYAGDNSISMGVYMTVDGDNYDSAFANADKALYHTKKSGKDGYSMYS